MSGLAVIYNLDGRPADAALLDRMLSAIAHRGRDGMGRWIDGPVAIGHAMLHTTPESVGEPQPLRDDSLCLTFDGRIDNREELAAAFKSAGVELKGDGDAELVLRAYQVWADESPRRLLGDFAYALWDGRNHRLFCARDPMGTKPFYYYRGPGFFLCASELHQILEDSRVRLVPNEPMVAEYLLNRYSTREETLFSGVMRLAGGDCLIVRPDGVNKHTWFELDPGKQIRYRTDEEYAEHLRGLVEEAVRCRMRSSSGVASELSGGIDSSAVVGVVQKLLREGRLPPTRFETFSLSFAEPESDESSYSDEVVAMWHLTANSIAPIVPTLQSGMERVRRYKEAPIPPNCEMLDSMKRAIAAKGFRVCLTGLGGDDWQTGSFYYYAELLRGLRFRELAHRLRDDRHLMRADRLHYFNGYYPFVVQLLKSSLVPFIPAPAHRLLRRARGRAPFAEWLNPQFARQIGLAERFRNQHKLPPGEGSLTRRQKYQLLKEPLESFFLETAERSSSWFGFDIRHPLHDLRIIEFTLATPDDQRRRGELQKFTFRNAMRGVVPPAILKRLDKAEFSPLYIRALENLHEAGLFDLPRLTSTGWVNGESIRNKYREMLSMRAKGDAKYIHHIGPLFTACAMELWLALALDRNDAPVAGREHRAEQAVAN